MRRIKLGLGFAEETFAEENGFQLAKWGLSRGLDGATVNMRALPIEMCESDGTANPLVKRGDFGADLIRFPASGGVREHVHEGDHILVVLGGVGDVIVEGVAYGLRAGLVYLVPGEVRHAIRAETDLVMMAIGNRHVAAGDPARLRVVE